MNDLNFDLNEFLYHQTWHIVNEKKGAQVLIKTELLGNLLTNEKHIAYNLAFLAMEKAQV